MAYGWGWRPYVSVAARQRKAEREIKLLKKSGRTISPVEIEGRAIAKTFWGKAWCDNLESYSDYENRLPRGRTYVRNGSVVDLQISSGSIRALVMGSDLYEVTLAITALPNPRWSAICADCGDAIDSLVELLQGRFSKSVMERLCRQNHGLFPSPGELRLRCSCPDSAGMCKHIAAVLYGVGARLDHQPELLFRLRAVDEKDLIVSAGRGTSMVAKGAASGKVLAGDDLGDIFGLDMASDEVPASAPIAKKAIAKKAVAKKAVAKKAVTKKAVAKKAVAKKAVAKKAVAQQTVVKKAVVKKAVVKKAPPKTLAKEATSKKAAVKKAGKAKTTPSRAAPGNKPPR